MRTVAIGRTIIALSVLAALLAVPAAASGGSGGGGLGCDGQEYVQPFVRFLDPLQYVLIPGGDFETGAAGWTLSGGARVVAGNTPFSIRGGASSLYLPGGSSAVSPEICVGLLHPTLRFFADGRLLSSLKVEMLFSGLLGEQMAVEIPPGAAGTGSFAPTLPLPHLGSVLPATSLDGLSADVRFRFTPRPLLFSAPAWRIDDVYVDPFSLGNSGI